MKKITVNSQEDQHRRLKAKNQSQMMINLAMEGTGISQWEAEVLVKLIDEVYFSDKNLQELRTGHVKYQCISATEGAGKPLKKCQMVTASLTLFHEEDKGDFSSENNKDRSVELRRRRLMRITEQAKEQGGYLSQEDLAELLMCDVRTIRRDVLDLKSLGVFIPTRGQQKDIGPGISHRAVAIHLWLEGKEPVAVAQHIKHSIQAVEIYLQKFKRVAFLKAKHFEVGEIALLVGISHYAAVTFSGLYDESKNTTFFKQRMREINLVGSEHYLATDEKKTSISLKGVTLNMGRLS